MSRVIFNTATSFNGFIADTGDSLDWLFEVSSPGEADFNAFFDRIGAMVCGSTTYEWVLEHENLVEQPDKWKDFYGARPTFVFTSRDLPRPEGADITFLEGDVSRQLDRIRESAAKRDVWVMGGGDLAAQFLKAGALDQIDISIAPVALSGGAPLFPAEVRSDRLTLVSAEQRGQFAHLVFDVGEPTGTRD